jgi:hypothetical protein
MSPALDQDLGLEQRIEELAIEKLGAEFPAERFDMTILPRASGLELPPAWGLILPSAPI